MPLVTRIQVAPTSFSAKFSVYCVCVCKGEVEYPNRMDLIIMTLENGLLTTMSRCICSEICKNNRGLKIHQPDDSNSLMRIHPGSSTQQQREL